MPITYFFTNMLFTYPVQKKTVVAAPKPQPKPQVPSTKTYFFGGGRFGM